MSEPPPPLLQYKLSRTHQLKKRLAEPMPNDNNDTLLIVTDKPLAMTTHSKRKFNANKNVPSKSSRIPTTATTYISIALEEDWIKNKSLFHKFTLDTSKVIVANVSDVGFKFNKEFNGKL